MAVKFVSNEGNATVVKVIQSASADQQPGSNPEIRKRSYAETAQFQENFEVYTLDIRKSCHCLIYSLFSISENWATNSK